MVTASGAAQIYITVVYSAAHREVCELLLTLDAGSTLAHAVAAAIRQGIFVPPGVCVGVWGKKAATDQVLLDQDRVEIYRSLKVDPKVARRLRFAKQGAKTAGLFSNRRADSKAGY